MYLSGSADQKSTDFAAQASIPSIASDAAGSPPNSSVAPSDDAIGTSPAALSANNSALSLTVSDGAVVAIGGASAQSITFTSTTGVLKLDDASAFTGQVAGLSGSDALDLADITYGTGTTATYLGTTSGGTLTVSDGTDTANIELKVIICRPPGICPATAVEAPSLWIRYLQITGKHLLVLAAIWMASISRLMARWLFGPTPTVPISGTEQNGSSL